MTSELRLKVWFKDPRARTGLTMYRRGTMDFGDAASALIVRIIQKKFLMPMAKYEELKHTIDAGGYADNYSNSFETLKEYKMVSEDMEEIHRAIGLPLKGTYTNVATDPKILEKLGKENDENPSYTFLGINWNLLTNEVKPNTYFNMAKKSRGASGEKNIIEMEESEFRTEPFWGGITQRVLSRLAAQCYDRLGLFLGPLTTGLKILVSRSTVS